MKFNWIYEKNGAVAAKAPIQNLKAVSFERWSYLEARLLTGAQEHRKYKLKEITAC